MMRIAVLDDNPEHLQIIGRSVSRFLDSSGTDHQLYLYSDPDQLIREFFSVSFPIFLLDIDMKTESFTGIDIANTVSRTCPSAQIIFITAYEKYYIDAYRADHIYLVPKQRIDELLPEALEKALTRLKQNRSEILTVRFNRKIHRIPERSVHYMEKTLRKVTIHADRVVECYSSLEEILAQTSSGVLIQCHKSFAVNIDFIASVGKNTCILLDGTELPVSKKYRSDIIEKLTSRT